MKTAFPMAVPSTSRLRTPAARLGRPLHLGAPSRPAAQAAVVLALALLAIGAAMVGAPRASVSATGAGAYVLAGVIPGSYAWLRGLRDGDPVTAWEPAGVDPTGQTWERLTVMHGGQFTEFPRQIPGSGQPSLLLAVLALAALLALWRGAPFVAPLAAGAGILAAVTAVGELAYPLGAVPSVVVAVLGTCLVLRRAARPRVLAAAVAAGAVVGAAWLLIPPATPTGWQALTLLAPLAVVAMFAAAYSRAFLAALPGIRRRGLPPWRPTLLRVMPGLRAVSETARNEERSRLARDLHADVLPRLSYTLTLLEHPSAGTDPGAATEQLRSAVAELRDLMTERQFLVLERGGMAAAISTLAELARTRSGIDVECDCHGEARYAPEVELAAYRIVQEAFENALKHSGAACVSIAVQAEPGRFSASVEDDGVGIDAATEAIARRNGHLGLSDMRGRAADVGGSLAITTASGEGTRVEFRWPA